MLWEAKAKLNDNYTPMKTPSGYKLNGKDLDKKSYRSIATGNVKRPVILGKKWLKFSFSFNYTTEEEIEPILTMINNYPLYVKLKSPMWGTNGIVELDGYVSDFEAKMIQNKETGADWGQLTFDFVQGRRVAGQ